MQEIELKFQIPAAARARVQRAVATRTATTLRLQAVYYDTAGRDLARAGMALRLRSEGGDWVQTLKGLGEHAMLRLEDEHRLGAPGDGSPPRLEVARHADSEVGRRLLALLEPLGGPVALTPSYQTDILRTARRLRHPRGTVELALDVGRILAGEAVHEVHELEMELVDGEPVAVLETACTWVHRHGLWLDTRSKAQMGERLLRGGPEPVRKAQAPRLSPRQGPQAVARAALQTHIRQSLECVSDLCAGDTRPELIHQARVALRRLRAALDLVGPEASPLPPEGLDGLRALFRQLGAMRDRDVLSQVLAEVATLRGAPEPLQGAGPSATGASSPSWVDGLRSPEVQSFWLLALGAALDDPAAPEETAWAGAARRRLRRWHRSLCRQAEEIAAAPLEARHTWRKRAKRLRYGLELARDCFKAADTERLLQALVRAQQALGDRLDLVLLEEHLQGLDDSTVDPGVWFARGWCTARCTATDEDVRRAMQGLVRIGRLRKA